MATQEVTYPLPAPTCSLRSSPLRSSCSAVRSVEDAFDSDLLLVEQILEACSDEAFERLYRKYKRQVGNMCFRMTNNPTLAEDLTQEVFMHLWTELHKFESQSSFWTWFYRLAVNVVLMELRKCEPEFLYLDEEPGDDAAPFEVGGEDPRLKSAITRIMLEKALATLEPEYWMCLVLHDLQGFEHEEIASMLGIHEGTSKTRAARARAAAKSSLLGEEKQEKSPRGRPFLVTDEQVLRQYEEQMLQPD